MAADRYLGDFALHPAGHSIALETRGKLFTMPLWEEAVRQYGRPDGVRYRLAAWVGDGSSIVVVSDEGGEDGIEIHKAGEAESAGGSSRSTSAASPTWPPRRRAPTSPWPTTATSCTSSTSTPGTSRLLDRSEHGALDGVVWSPDGRWLAYSFAATARTRSIKLCEVATGATHLVTQPEFRDVHPSWDPDGKFLYFLSYRVFDPVYDSLYFDLGFPRAIRPYLVTLTAEEPSPFVPKPRGMGGATPKPPGDRRRTEPSQPRRRRQEEAGTRADKPAGPAPMRIDLEGIAERVVPVPVPEGRYSQVVGIKGKILLTSWPVQGSLGRDSFSGGPGPRGTLEVYDLAEQRHDVLTGGINGFEVSRDGQTLAYRVGAPAPGDQGGGEAARQRRRRQPPQRLARPRPGAGVGRPRQRVDADVQGGLAPPARPLLGRGHVGRRLVARPRPLHCRWSGRWPPASSSPTSCGRCRASSARRTPTSSAATTGPPPPTSIAHLGADLAYDADADGEGAGTWRFTHIVDGDPWDPEAGSPLRAPGVRISAGDRLLAVNGRPVNAATTPASLLVNQAGLAVELTVARRRRQRASAPSSCRPCATTARPGTGSGCRPTGPRSTR